MPHADATPQVEPTPKPTPARDWAKRFTTTIVREISAGRYMELQPITLTAGILQERWPNPVLQYVILSGASDTEDLRERMAEAYSAYALIARTCAVSPRIVADGKRANYEANEINISDLTHSELLMIYHAVTQEVVPVDVPPFPAGDDNDSGDGTPSADQPGGAE